MVGVQPFWGLMASSFVSRRSESERSDRNPERSSSSTATSTPEPSPHGSSQWPDLVRRLRMGDRAAMEELYRVFSEGVRFYLWRQLGPQDLTD